MIDQELEISAVARSPFFISPAPLNQPLCAPSSGDGAVSSTSSGAPGTRPSKTFHGRKLEREVQLTELRFDMLLRCCEEIHYPSLRARFRGKDLASRLVRQRVQELN